jgi:hypothetical protein
MRAVLLGLFVAISLAGCALGSTPPQSPSAASAPAAASNAPAEASKASGSPSGSPSGLPAAAVTPGPSSTPRLITGCLATQLAAKVTLWYGAMGHQTGEVTVTNTSAHSCTVQGTPEVELLDAHGGILIDSRTSGAAGLPHVAKGAPIFRLAHGGSLKTLVQDDNYCGAAPALPTTVAFVLPAGAGRLVAAPGPGGAVPPCSRSPGSLGSIEMNGWST